MKKVLVTGENGYIGTKFKEWIQASNSEIELNYISVRGENWREIDFNGYDAILHLAGIAHVSRNPKFKEMYYQINRDLTINLAKKARKENVKHFIFMSSIIIYGQGSAIGNYSPIDENTKPIPSDFYGDSKLQADLKLQEMSTESFKVAIIRTPLVYGPGSKGNFTKLLNLAKRSFVFINLENRRSMIYIDNLNSLIEKIITESLIGVFFPQNQEYVSTKNIIEVVAKTLKRKIYYLKFLNYLVKTLSYKFDVLNKVFGNLYYDQKISNSCDYNVVSFDESIKRLLDKKKTNIRSEKKLNA